MRKSQILRNLIKRGYNPHQDSEISKGGTVYKYSPYPAIIERIYVVESNIEKPFWGMNPCVVNKLAKIPGTVFTVLLNTYNDKSYLVNKQDIINLANGTLPVALSTDARGNYKITDKYLNRINAMELEDDVALIEFIMEQL